MAETYEEDYFESYVDRYRTSLHDLRREDLVLSLIAPRNGEVILDLGCGVGHCSFRVSGTGAEVIAADSALAALSLGRREYRLQYPVRADARQLPFGGTSFDRVIGIELIEHIEEQDALFSELSRVLRVGGTLLLTTSPITSSFFFPFVQKVRRSRLVHTIVRPYDISGEKHVSLQHPRAIGRRLRAHGFEIIAERYWNALHMSYFLSKTNIAFLRRLWPASRLLDRCVHGPTVCNDVVFVARKCLESSQGSTRCNSPTR